LKIISYIECKCTIEYAHSSACNRCCNAKWVVSLPAYDPTVKLNKRLRPALVHYENLINAEIISAVSTLLKSRNRVYKFLVRPELQHDVIRHTDHCITAIA
jgi:hypothetical protein